MDFIRNTDSPLNLLSRFKNRVGSLSTSSNHWVGGNEYDRIFLVEAISSLTRKPDNFAWENSRPFEKLILPLLNAYLALTENNGIRSDFLHDKDGN